ncbi:uncharacterized protein ACA1_019160 [Acanthamoeba castellanii str. Neff]|uniref:Uncharacterized protein n=1 Tax=Acanthamoeba castellanii (strain ATCC 30010 / Neff) TaxID=1257118 RepID=L8HHA9_ACACF|nr:uncharacterized protein ACA1_019160 [Acanthamoeba castellanii str. Neff]ELR24068.1 hypothetical protein ACA1_019160 [Acanthamoeba castellanii str. Neff]
MEKNNTNVHNHSDKKLKRADSIELCPKHYFSFRRQMSVINHTPCNLYIILTVDPDTLVLRGVGGNVGAGVGTNPLTVLGGKVSGGANVQMGTSSVPPQVQGLAAGERANLYMTSKKAYMSVLAMTSAPTPYGDLGGHGDLLIHNRLVRFGNIFHVLFKHMQQPVQRDVEYDLANYTLTKRAQASSASNWSAYPGKVSAGQPVAQQPPLQQSTKLTEPPAPFVWNDEPKPADNKPAMGDGQERASDKGYPAAYYQTGAPTLPPPSAFIPTVAPACFQYNPTGPFTQGQSYYGCGKVEWAPGPMMTTAQMPIDQPQGPYLQFPEPLPFPTTGLQYN